MNQIIVSSAETRPAEADSRKIYRDKVTALKAANYRELPLAAFIEVFAASYYSWFRRQRSPVTGPNQAGHLQTFKTVCPHLFTGITVSDLTELDIDEACERLGEAYKPGTNELYANDSYNVYIGALGRLLKYLAAPPWKLIDNEQLIAMRAIIRQYWADPKPRQHKLPSLEQQRAMNEYVLRKCGRGRKRIQSLIIYQLFDLFGIRKGMVDLIYRRDLDMERREITLTFNKKRNGEKICVVLDMTNALHTAFSQFLTHWSGGRDDVLLEVRNISKLIQSAARAAGLEHFSPHCFRKLFITRALQAGIDIPMVAFLVGHKDGGRSIQRNYYQFCPTHARKSMRRLTARNDIHVQTAEGRANQYHWMKTLFEAILLCPSDIQERCLRFEHQLMDALSQKNYAAVWAMTPPSESALPAKAGDANPYVPQSRSLWESQVIAANVRNLFWHAGEGYHKVASKLELPATAIYNILKGQQQTEVNLTKLAAHFGISLDDLRNPQTKRYDTERVVANISYLATVFGQAGLPCTATVAQVIAGIHLPSGDVIKTLAAFAKIALTDFLTKDISQLGIDKQKGEADARRARLAGNLKVFLLLNFLDVSKASRRIGISTHRLNDYVLGRLQPPLDHLEVIAKNLGTTVEALEGPAIELHPSEIGRRVSSLLAQSGYTATTSALKMRLGSKRFTQVALGELPPNCLQLRRMCAYFGVGAAQILGIDPTPFPRLTLGKGDSPLANSR